MKFCNSMKLCQDKEAMFSMCTSWDADFEVWRGVRRIGHEDGESKQKIGRLGQLIGHP